MTNTDAPAGGQKPPPMTLKRFARGLWRRARKLPRCLRLTFRFCWFYVWCRVYLRAYPREAAILAWQMTR